ncbi:uncharacterized protein LOC127258326 isoform X2 [Andrographis paniculata]|uniref:uncharacterized protein LOC127258326 isoform X2 n=1 Tax=Andrographis paniculata TaxID=175694 RepID=UPI0021E7566E|nr:uncharacterized protein LOC127258326 isoform X2 [Andrographis paniculata]
MASEEEEERSSKRHKSGKEVQESPDFLACSSYAPSNSQKEMPWLEHILERVFFNLPVQSLVRLKFAYKAWEEILTNPRYWLSSSPEPNPALGLVCNNVLGKNPLFQYFSYENHHHRIDSNQERSGMFDDKFLKNASSASILHSSGGMLLLTYMPRDSNSMEPCYAIYHPATSHFSRLDLPPEFQLPRLSFMYVVYDPDETNEYTIVGIRYVPCKGYRVEVYWPLLETIVSYPHYMNIVNFENGVYCNARLHWICEGDIDFSWYYVVHTGSLQIMPSIKSAMTEEDFETDWTENYFFGESFDRLTFVPIGRSTMIFSVYQMKSIKNDYNTGTGWTKTYQGKLLNTILLPRLSKS